MYHWDASQPHLEHSLHVHSKQLFLPQSEAGHCYPEDHLHTIHQEAVHHAAGEGLLQRCGEQSQEPRRGIPGREMEAWDAAEA